MTARRRTGGALGLALLALTAAAPAGAATSNSFLPIAGGARAWGMAGAGVATVAGADAAFWNPARLAFGSGTRASAGYASLVEDVGADRIEAAVARSLGPRISHPFQGVTTHRAAVGASVEYLGLDLSQGSRYSELALGLSAAFAPLNFAAFGVTVRALRADSDLDGVEATGAALDVGASVALHPRIETAILLRNLVGSVEFQDVPSEDLVRSITGAVAWTRNGWLTLELDVTGESEGAVYASLGGEFLIGGVAGLRGGVRQWVEPDSRVLPAAGVGLGGERFSLDYGVQLDEEDALGIAHRITLNGRLP